MTTNRVFVTYFTIAGFYTLAAALIWGVNTLFLLDAGLDIFEVFIANAMFTVGSVLFEIPTGVLADSRGRRVSFLLSVSILLATTLAYVGVAKLGGGVIWFSSVSVLMGLGFTFYSGAVEAWLVDALNETGYSGSLDRVFARGSMITSGAMLFGTVVGGLLGTLDLALPYLVRAAMLVLVFGVAYFTMHDLGFTPSATSLSNLPSEMRRLTRVTVKFGWERQSVRLLTMYSFVSWGFMTWAYYAWQPYFLELLGEDAVWVAGIVAALIALSIMIGNALVDWISQYCGRRSTLRLWAAGIQTAAAIAIGLTNSFWLAVGLFLIVAVALGVAGPVKQAFLHQMIPAQQRASVISFDSMMGSAGGVCGQSALGYLSRAASISDAFVAGGVATLAALPILTLLRQRFDTADVFAGEKAGAGRTCAPQGIPEISQLAATSAPDPTQP